MNEPTRALGHRPTQDAPEDGAEPLLTLHAAVVLLVAVFIGLVIGGLTFLSTKSIPGAVLAGLVTGGGSLSKVRSLIN